MRQLTAIILALTVPVQASADEGSGVPVRVGGDAEFDACSSVGEVSELASGRLRVRSGPGLDHRQLDSVASGQVLWLCGQDANWVAVVYAENDTQDCGVSTPIVPQMEYAGPCRSGWVHKDYVSLIAG